MIFTTCIIKGGSGKTTTAAALLQAGKAAGLRCLAIDLDPQANLTAFVNADPNRPGAHQLIAGLPAEKLLQQTAQGIDCIAGGAALAAVQSGKGSALRLAAGLRPIKSNYDLIVIDTPPAAGELVFNALQAADRLLIPLEADPANLQGLYQIHSIAQQIQRSNPALKPAGVIITRYDKRSKINRTYAEAIQERAGALDIPFIGTIRNCVAIREAQAMRESLYTYAPRSNAAADYNQVFKTIM